jgi:hypothetical protein
MFATLRINKSFLYLSAAWKLYFGRTISKRWRVRQYQCGLAMRPMTWKRSSRMRSVSRSINSSRTCTRFTSPMMSHPRDGSGRNKRNEEGIRTVGMFSFEIEFHMSEYIDLLGSPHKNHARCESSSTRPKNPAVSALHGKRNDDCN